MNQLFALLLVCTSAVYGELLSTDVKHFSTDYALYFSYTSPGRHNVALNIHSGTDIALHISPHYDYVCPVLSTDTLVMNSRIADKWKTEETPQGFPFFLNEPTSVIVTPQKSAYHILAQAADTTFTYDFSYRNGQTPTTVTKVSWNYGKSACPPEVPAKIYALSIGYYIPTYSKGCVVHIHATAPSTGNMAIDISLGEPEDKDNLPVALKVNVFFDDDPKILLFSAIKGLLIDEQIIHNPIIAGNTFNFNIVLQQERYQLIVNKAYLASFDHVVPLPSTPGPATVWVTGVPTLSKIKVY